MSKPVVIVNKKNITQKYSLHLFNRIKMFNKIIVNIYLINYFPFITFLLLLVTRASKKSFTLAVLLQFNMQPTSAPGRGGVGGAFSATWKLNFTHRIFGGKRQLGGALY